MLEQKLRDRVQEKYDAEQKAIMRNTRIRNEITKYIVSYSYHEYAVFGAQKFICIPLPQNNNN